MIPKIEAIDLFCWIWGLSYGLEEAWIRVLAWLDNDWWCKDIYEKNNSGKFIEADVSEYDFHEMKNLYSKWSIKVLVWCAPCQPFSSHTFKSKNKKDDSRWNLIDYFLSAVKILQPDIISMENVRGITKTEVFKEFIKNLSNLGYYIEYNIIYCPDYWIPQNRSRLVLLASKRGNICILKKTHSKENYLTVRDAIGSLPLINSWQTHSDDQMHKTRDLSELNLKRLADSKPWWTWNDRDPILLPECYTRETGKTYTSVYWRMSRDEVSPTITTQFHNYWSGRFGHPEQNRALSLREWALIQTFPKDYIFGEDIGISKIGKWIWNAVPPKLWYIIWNSIREHLV